MTTLLELDTNTSDGTVPGVMALGRDLSLVKLYDDPANPHRVLEATELFEPNCFVLIPERAGADEHPLNSYDIAYPYCRTAVRVRLDDADPNPLLAQVTNFSRFLSLRLIADVCGRQVALALCRVRQVLPAQTTACVVTSIIQPSTKQGFLIVDGLHAIAPFQALLELVAMDGTTRQGWINVLPPGWVGE